MSKAPRTIRISDLRQRASDVIRSTQSGDPVFVTEGGRAAAVILSAKAYQDSQHQLHILRLLARGEKEIHAGVGYELDDVLEEAGSLLRAMDS